MGREIKRLRAIRGWSAEELAEQAGISTSSIKKIEAGAVDNPLYETVCNIFETFDINLPLLIKEASSPSMAEERITQLYGGMHGETIALLESIFADRRGREYILEQARLWIAFHKKKG